MEAGLPIDKSATTVEMRRAAASFALGNNALEGLSFDEHEMAIVQRYIDGEIDSESMRLLLLALPVR